MKFSIILTHYNRPVQLLFSIATIAQSKLAKDCEIIIVDDASDIKPYKFAISKFNLNIKYVEIKAENKWWINPCVAYNIGFQHAFNEIFIIQNAEVAHCGDILLNIKDNIKDKTYISYACYSLDKETTNKLYNLENVENFEHYLKPRNKNICSIEKQLGWLNHSRYNISPFNYLSVITMNDLYKIGVFNEKFASGYCCDDDEFLFRLRKNNFNIKIINRPYAIHQWHERCVVKENYNELRKINLDILYKETGINYG